MALNYFSRNIGLITTDDQNKISDCVIGIAGVGADGGLTAERVARLGVKKIKLADPEVFEETNINRQYGAAVNTLGKNKCLVVAEELKKIRPDLEIETFSNGINPENIDAFVRGCSIVIDEIEYTLPKLTILLHERSEASNIEVFSGLNIGFGINLYRFIPGGLSYKSIIGMDEKSVDSDFVMDAFVPNIPSYIDSEVVKRVLNKESYIPAVSPAVGLLAGYMSFVILGSITGKWTISPVPEYVHIDMRTNQFAIKKI